MLWLFVLFVVAPLVELYVLFQVSNQIGFLESVVLLVAIAAVGAWLVKREGLRVWRRFQEQVAAGATPDKELADGVLLLAAGALMMAPGFVSDGIGLLLVLPPTRALARKVLMARFRAGASSRVRVVRATYGGRMNGQGFGNNGYSDGSVTDTTSTEIRGELDS